MFALFVIFSWVPRGCPVVRKYLVGCPAPLIVPKTLEEQELSRVPHQSIASTVTRVDVKAEPARTNTRVYFEYRTPVGSTMTFGIQTNQGVYPLATITTPLLANVSWNKLISHTPDASLFSRSEISAGSIEQFFGSKPQGLVADPAAAQLFHIASTDFTPLSSVSSLDPFNAVLVSYLASVPDNTWDQFEQVFDLSSFPTDTVNHLTFIITDNSASEATPLLLGEVHVNYQK